MDLFAHQIKQSHRTLNLCLCQSSSLFAHLDHNEQCTTKRGIILVKTTWFDLTNKMVLTKTLQWPWWMQKYTPKAKTKTKNCGHGTQMTLLLLSITDSVTGIESHTDNKTDRRVRFNSSDLCCESFSGNLGTFSPDLAVKRQETTHDIGEKIRSWAIFRHLSSFQNIWSFESSRSQNILHSFQSPRMRDIRQISLRHWK